MKLADGTALPELKSTLHTHSWRWALGSKGECTVTEREMTGGRVFFQLTAGGETDLTVGAGFLAAIVSHRLGQGWTLHSMDASSALMERIGWA